MGEVTVRAAEAEDAEAVARIQVAGWRWAYAGIMDGVHLAGLDVARRADVWRRVVVERPGGSRVLVGERGGRIAGFASYGRSRDADAAGGTGQVFAIYVDPDLVGAGVGAALMNAALAGLAAEGFEQATLWVLEANDVGRAFYAKGGWRPDGATQEETFGGRPLVELRLRRPVPTITPDPDR